MGYPDSSTPTFINTFHSPTDSTWNPQEWTGILRNGPESAGIGLESTGIGPESTGIDWNLEDFQME
jgi:hypothetical protein